MHAYIHVWGFLSKPNMCISEETKDEAEEEEEKNLLRTKNKIFIQNVQVFHS